MWRVSPDGLLVAVAIRDSDTIANCYYSSIFIYPVDGSPSWPLTAGQTRDWAPRWSPDGRQLAFLSNRGASTQVWLIGPARRGAAVDVLSTRCHRTPGMVA